MNKACDFDVAIIGAGPAGSAAAISLPSELSVVQLEKKKAAGGKLCSGLLTAEAMESARRLTGEKDLPAHIKCHSPAAVLRSVDFDNGLTTTLDVGYLNMRRDDFDKWLYSKVSRDNYESKFGVKVQMVSRENGGFRIECRENGAASTVRAKYVIDASGWAGASYDGGLYPLFARRFALQFILKPSGDEKENEYRAYFLKSATDWFGWTIPKDDGIEIGMGFRRNGAKGKPADDKSDSDASVDVEGGRYAVENASTSVDGSAVQASGESATALAPTLFIGFLRELNKNGYLTSLDLPDEGDSAGIKQFFKKHAIKGCPITSLSSVKSVSLGHDGIFVIGEAAGLVSPSSGDGISYALASGIAIGKVFESQRGRNSKKGLNLDNGEAYKTYRDLLAQELRELRFNIQKAKMLSNPKLRNAALRFLTWHSGRRMERL